MTSMAGKQVKRFAGGAVAVALFAVLFFAGIGTSVELSYVARGTYTYLLASAFVLLVLVSALTALKMRDGGILIGRLLLAAGLGFSAYVLYAADSAYMYLLSVAFVLISMVAGLTFMKIEHDRLVDGRLLTAAIFAILVITGLGFSIYLFYIADSTNIYLLATATAFVTLIAGITFVNIERDGQPFEGRVPTAAAFTVLAILGLGASMYMFFVADSTYSYLTAIAFAFISMVAGLIFMKMEHDKLFESRMLTVALFMILSSAGLGFSIYLFYVASSPYMFMLAVSFTFMSVVSGLFNVYASIWYYRSYYYGEYLDGITRKLMPLRRLPAVSIAVPAYNEEPDMVDENLSLLEMMNYPREKMHIYLLDDSSDAKMREGLERVAKKHGVAYLHRDSRKGFKAGALNNMLKYAKEEVIAVFDADEKLVDRNFLRDLLPYFSDPKLSYIQTEKRYQKGSFFSESVDIFDAFFFKFIQPARALNNTAVFAGSCGLLRRSAVEGIGGFPEYVIEDTFFSFESDMHHYKSLYVPKVYARGRPIRKFSELIKQQWRYNYGDTQFISYFLKRKGFSTRSPLSNMDYITHGFGLNYLSVVLIIFTLISIGIVFSAVPFSHINVYTFFTQNQLSLDLELLGFFAFTLSLLTPVLLTRVYFNSWSKGFMVFLLNYALAFVRTKAAVATMLNMNPGSYWNRLKTFSNNKSLIGSIMNTKVEMTFAVTMFVLSYLALSESNISGGIWLMWYGVLYSLTTLFLHKYG